MSTAHVVPAPSGEVRSLSREEWWELFDKLRLAQQPAYDALGGSLVFLRRERDADEHLA